MARSAFGALSLSDRHGRRKQYFDFFLVCRMVMMATCTSNLQFNESEWSKVSEMKACGRHKLQSSCSDWLDLETGIRVYRVHEVDGYICHAREPVEQERVKSGRVGVKLHAHVPCGAEGYRDEACFDGRERLEEAALQFVSVVLLRASSTQTSSLCVPVWCKSIEYRPVRLFMNLD